MRTEWLTNRKNKRLHTSLLRFHRKGANNDWLRWFNSARNPLIMSRFRTTSYHECWWVITRQKFSEFAMIFDDKIDIRSISARDPFNTERRLGDNLFLTRVSSNICTKYVRHLSRFEHFLWERTESTECIRYLHEFLTSCDDCSPSNVWVQTTYYDLANHSFVGSHRYLSLKLKALKPMQLRLMLLTKYSNKIQRKNRRAQPPSQCRRNIKQNTYKFVQMLNKSL